MITGLTTATRATTEAIQRGVVPKTHAFYASGKGRGRTDERERKTTVHMATTVLVTGIRTMPTTVHGEETHQKRYKGLGMTSWNPLARQT